MNFSTLLSRFPMEYINTNSTVNLVENNQSEKYLLGAIGLFAVSGLFILMNVL
jgi:hypothetical protein